jgi:hypothetical protein
MPSKYVNVTTSFLDEDYKLLQQLQKKLQAKTPYQKVSISATIRYAAEHTFKTIK